MKNILFFIEGLHGGGAEKALIELLNNFDYHRYKVTLCVVYYGGVYTNQIPAPVEVVYLYDEKRDFLHKSLKRKSFRYFKKRGSTWLMRWLVSHKIGRKKFDATISFIEGSPLHFHHLMRQRSKKNIAWVHCDLYNYHWTTTFFKDSHYEELCYRQMDELVFVSRNSMNAFDKLYDVNVPKQCIYNIVDVQKIHEKSVVKTVNNDAFTIIAIGSLINVKGFDRLIRVARLFKDNGYKLSFQILGVGDNEEELLAQCKALEVEDSVALLGFRNPPYPYLVAADVLVSTSLSEGLPFVICEALTLGVPIVATKTAGSIELLENGKYGLLTDHDDKAIYDGLKEMIDNNELREEFKVKSKERALLFDVDQTMSRIYHLIES